MYIQKNIKNVRIHQRVQSFYDLINKSSTLVAQINESDFELKKFMFIGHNMLQVYVDVFGA